MNVSDEDMQQAVDRIARSHDGHVLYLYLQKIMMGIPVDSSDGALRENFGRRRFASEIVGLMAKGIEESGGSDASSRPVVFTIQRPDAGKRHVSAREFLKQQLAGEQQPAAGEPASAA